MRSKLATLVIFTSPLLALAGQWEICDYTVQIESSALSGVRATVKEATLKNPELCEKIGTSLSFSPESEDYQSVLPRKRWPKVGTITALRYRQLTGFCKRDGDTQPCTIRHYSVLTRTAQVPRSLTRW
ncbi:hypothetical protein J2X15_000966 [Rhodoferax saidenbachensis]|uniref:DUF3617 domain-containing protein n=1 Tax=Rhodoferax saidenbachensis TaxID=1484693 RepID=A0ABU1ZJY3_9BURK|nr:hypothetical protein [Rhodoferax saidenbachensis]